MHFIRVNLRSIFSIVNIDDGSLIKPELYFCNSYLGLQQRTLWQLRFSLQCALICWYPRRSTVVIENRSFSSEVFSKVFYRVFCWCITHIEVQSLRWYERICKKLKLDYFDPCMWWIRHAASLYLLDMNKYYANNMKVWYIWCTRGLTLPTRPPYNTTHFYCS